MLSTTVSEQEGAAHSLVRPSSMTSTTAGSLDHRENGVVNNVLWWTRLFAIRSSEPTVTRTGLRMNSEASWRTPSGHVALTVHALEDGAGGRQVRRTHDGLPLRDVLGEANDPADIVLEAPVEHAICLVQHEVRYAG